MTDELKEEIKAIVFNGLLYKKIGVEAINATIFELHNKFPDWVVAYKPYFGENYEDPTGIENNTVELLFIKGDEKWVYHLGQEWWFEKMD